MKPICKCWFFWGVRHLTSTEALCPGENSLQSRTSGGPNFIQIPPNCHSSGSSVKGPGSQQRVPATLCSILPRPPSGLQPSRGGKGVVRQGGDKFQVQGKGREGQGRQVWGGPGTCTTLGPNSGTPAPWRPPARDHAPAHPSPSHQTHTY